MPESDRPFEEPAEQSCSSVERRRTVRYPCNLRPTWRVLGSQGTEGRVARVRDISTHGLCLRLLVPVKLGTVLLVSLQHPSQRLSRPLPVRVMHATPQDDGTWLVGGVFVRRLQQEELAAILETDQPEEADDA